MFPKQIKVVEGGFGNLVKLPLGVHRKTGQRSYFLDDNFNEIKSMEEVVKRLSQYLD